MKNEVPVNLISVLVLFIFLSGCITPEKPDVIHYSGTTLCNIDYHHGQLSPAVGVHNVQVMRANREMPETADGFWWTYNHAPMLAYWNQTFYLQYLSNPVGEHIPPGHTLLASSIDGYEWTMPAVLFPDYKIPDGTVKEGRQGVAGNLYAVMHQRMGFYVSKENRFLTFAYYGICMDDKDSPNDGKGIGRVVREIHENGNFGSVYFIRYNKGWDEKNTNYPFYTKSGDKGFVEACEEVLANPLMMQQWNEEADRDDPAVPLKGDYKAFCYYHLADGRVVGLWKYALTAISDDEGKTWTTPVRAPGFVNANAKIWGQRTSDGRYATVYNPSEFRWPLAVSVSEDGLDYHNLLLVNGEISTMRYGGNYKSYGPQYVRGILGGNGTPPDGKLWITYSMNKEDIWVASIPVPIKEKIDRHVDDLFNDMKPGSELESWNIFSPLWAPVRIETLDNGVRYLLLKDQDEFDYARAERLFPASEHLIIEFLLRPGQNDKGLLHIELQDEKGTPALRLIFDEDGLIKYKEGYRIKNIMNYNTGADYRFRIEAWTASRSYDLYINDSQIKTGLFFSPVHSLERIVFRTGEVRRFPDPDTPADQDFDVQQDGKPFPVAVYYLKYIKTEN